MAIFNPDIKNIEPEDYGRKSQPIPHYELPKAAVKESTGIALKGAGQATEGLLKVSDQIVKNYLDTDIRKDVETTRNAETQRYQNLLQGTTPQRVATDGTPVAQRDDPMTAHAEVPDDLEEDLTDTISTLGSAKGSRAISRTHLAALYDTSAKDFRSRYPGYADYIDDKYKHLTGMDPANAKLQGLITQYAQLNSQLNSHVNKMETQLLQHSKELGFEKAYKDLLTTGDVGKAAQWLHKAQQQKAQLDLDAAKRADIKGNRELVQSEAVDTFTKAANQMVVDDSREWLEGYGKTAEEQKANLAAKDPVELAMELNQRKARVAMHMYQTASIDKNGRNLYTDMTGPKFDEASAKALRFYDDQLAMLSNKEYGPMHAYAVKNARMMEEAKYLVLNDKEAGRDVATLGIVNQLGGPNAAALISDKLTKLAEKIPVALQPLFDKHTSDIARGEKTANQVIDEATARAKEELTKPSVGGPYFNGIFTQIEGITDPSIKPEQKRVWARAVFSEPGLIARIQREGTDPVTGQSTGGKYSVYKRLSTPEFVDSMKALGGKEWEDYVTWHKNTFGNELIKPDVQDMKNLTIPTGAKLTWNNEDHRFGVIDKDGTDLLLTRSNRGLAGPVISGYVQRALNNINSSLDKMKYVAEKAGFNVDTYLWTELRNLGYTGGPLQGIPQFMMDAIKTANEKSEEEKAKAEKTRAKYK